MKAVRFNQDAALSAIGWGTVDKKSDGALWKNTAQGQLLP